MDFVRHLYEQQGPSLDLFARTEVLLPSELHSLIASFAHPSQQAELHNFNEQLRQIIKNSSVYGIHLSRDRPSIVILGQLERLKAAAFAVEVFLNHQRLMHINRTGGQAQFQGQAQQAVQQQKKHSKEIEVHNSVVSMIIGQNAMNLKRVQQAHNVQITIPKQSREATSDLRKILVQGDSLKDVEGAIGEINFQRVIMGIEDQHLDYVCGDNDSNIDFMASKSGVITLNVEKNPETDSYQLVAVGLPQQIEDLRIIYSSHMTYFEQFN